MKNIAITLLLIIVASCTSEKVCYDATNWGNPVISVNSNPNAHNYPKANGYEMAKWQKSNYYLNGKEIYFVVSNSYGYAQNPNDNFYFNRDNYTSLASDSPGEFLYGWAYMFGGSNPDTSSLGSLMASSGRCKLCNKKDDDTCKNYKSSKQKACYSCNSISSPVNACVSKCEEGDPTCKDKSKCAASMLSEIPVTNNPCFMDHGLGVYMGIGKNASTSPDVSAAAPPVHVGVNELNSSPFYSINLQTGGVSMTSPCTSSQSCGVYFKMLDKIYSDNFGSVQIELLSGVQTGNPGIITNIVSTVQTSLCWARSEIFQNLVNGSQFQSYVKALLILYIVVYGISFLMGLVQITQKDLMMRVFKIAVILQLISPGAWDFFNDNFFEFFGQGMSEITGMIFGVNDSQTTGSAIMPTGLEGSDCPCKWMDMSGFEAIDNALDQLFSKPTMAKLGAVTFKSAAGVFLWVTLFAVLVIFLFVLIKSICFYLLSYLGLSLLIVLAPVFLPFMLFDFTRPLFANWLKYLISYFIQPIIILAFVFFLFQLIMNQIYYLIGYNVCYYNSTNVSTKYATVAVGQWKPVLPQDAKIEKIAIPNYHVKCDTSKPGCYKNVMKEGCNCTVCQPYECQGDRYPAYPYLDPADPTDSKRIQQFQTGDYNTITQFTDIISLIVMIIFMRRFAELVPEIAKDLGGTPMQMSDMDAAAGAMRGGIMNIAKAPLKAAASAAGVGLDKMTGGRVTGAKISKALGKARRGIEGIRVGIGTAGYKIGKAGSAAGDFMMGKTPGKFLLKRAANSTLNPLVVGKRPFKLVKNVVFKPTAGVLKTVLDPHRAIQDSANYAKGRLSKGAQGVGSYFTRKATEFRAAPGQKLYKAATSPFRLHRKEEHSRPWVQQLNSARDTVGGFVDTMYHAPKQAISGSVHKATFGMMGQKSTADPRHVAEQHRINMDKLSGRYTSNTPTFSGMASDAAAAFKAAGQTDISKGIDKMSSGAEAFSRGNFLGGAANYLSGARQRAWGNVKSAPGRAVSSAASAIGSTAAYKGFKSAGQGLASGVGTVGKGLASGYDAFTKATSGTHAGSIKGGQTIGSSDKEED
ncbi:MAG: type IV secretion system protein [Rickettsiales bacterium]